MTRFPLAPRGEHHSFGPPSFSRFPVRRYPVARELAGVTLGLAFGAGLVAAVWVVAPAAPLAAAALLAVSLALVARWNSARRP